jgi:hypothetical protein
MSGPSNQAISSSTRGFLFSRRASRINVLLVHHVSFKFSL